MRGRDRLGGFSGFEWAGRKVFWQIDRNLQDLYINERISKHFSKVWEWQF